MGSKGGGQSSTTNTQGMTSSSGSSSGVSSQTPDPLASLAYQQTLRNAAQIANTPYQPYQGQQVAGFVPDQLAAQQGYRDLQGYMQPYVDQAMDWTKQGVKAADLENYFNNFGRYYDVYNQKTSPYTSAANTMSGNMYDLSRMENFNQQALNRYMNPFQQSVIDATLGQMKQNQDVLQNQNTAQAIRQGAYGGSGQFMGQAELGRQQALSNAQTLAELNARNYNQAMQQYNQQQGVGMQGAQQAYANQMGLGRFMYDQVRAANEQQNQQQKQLIDTLFGGANLSLESGKTGEAGKLSELGALAQSGATQQALAQKQLDNAYQQWQQARAYPYQQTSYFGGLAQGLGPLMGQYGTQAGNFQQTGTEMGQKQTQSSGGGGGIAGAITSGLGLLSSLKSGGRVSDRKHRDMGGYMSHVGEAPYGEGPIDLKAGFGSLMQKDPYADAPGNYIAEAEKAGKVLKPAKELGAEKLKGQIDKALGMFPKQKSSSMGDDDGGVESSGGEADYKGLGKQLKGLYDKVESNDTIGAGLDFGSIGDTLGSFFNSGGSVGMADGGATPAGFVTDLFKKDVGREPDASELAYLTDLMDKGYTQEDIRKIYEPSGSSDSDWLKNTFLENFGREPLKTELDYYLGALGKGSTKDSLQKAFKDYAGTMDTSMGDKTWLYTQYLNDLGRVPTEKEFTDWSKLMQNGLSKEGAAKAISQTPEAAKSIQDIFQSKLNIPGMTGYGLEFWQDQMAKGKTLGDIKRYVGQSGLAKSYLEDAYSKAFDRGPEDSAVKYAQGLLSGPLSLEQASKSFYNTPEYKATHPKTPPVKGSYADLLYKAYGNDPGPQLSPENQGLPSMPTEDYYRYPSIGGGKPQVQGYFSNLASTTVNPYTGLFNLGFSAPYYGTAVPEYDLRQGIEDQNKRLDLVNTKLESQLPRTSKDGGRIGKAAGGGLSGKGLYDYFINLGANPKEATMLTGMAKAESNFNPSVMHDNNTGYGLWGHGKDRWADMQKYTGQRKPGWEDQAKFALWELRNSPKTAMARQTLARADDPREITIAGMHFERPRGYKANAPWLGDNWQGRLSNVTNLALGRDLGKGPSLELAGGQPNRDSLMYKNVATPASSAPRRNLLSRLVNELAPVGTAQAAEGQPAESKSMFAWPKLRNFQTNDLPTALGMNKPELPEWKKEVQTGFGTLGEDRPADQSQLLAEPTKHAAMGPEMEVPTPPKRSDAFPVVAEDREQGQKYYGDWRDQDPWKSDPIGGFFDALSGEEKKKDEPGKYDPDEGFGSLFGFAKGGAVRKHYAIGGGEEEDLGNPLEELGSMVEQGFGGLFGGEKSPAREEKPAPEAGGGLGDLLGGLFDGDEEAPKTPKGVVASDREPSPSTGVTPQETPHRGFLPPAVSQALIAAGLGMMASPRSNPFEAIGQGGLKGFQVYTELADQERKRDEARAQQQAAAEYEQRLSGTPVSEDKEETAAPVTERGSVTSGSNVDALMSQMERLSSIPAVTPQQIQQKNAKLRELQTRINITEKIEERRTGKIGKVTDEFGNVSPGYITGPNAGRTLEEVQLLKTKEAPSEPGEQKSTSDLHGEELLDRIPAQDRDMIRRIASGDEKIPPGKEGTRIKSLVTRFKPDFDENLYKTKEKMRLDYDASSNPTGAGGQMNAAGTAIKHLHDLSRNVDELENSGFIGWNELRHGFKQSRLGWGDPAAKAFEANKQLALEEISKFYKGGPPGESEAKRLQDQLSVASTPEELHTVINKLAHMMSGKTDELARRWTKTMGTDENPAGLEYPVISDVNKRRINDIDRAYEKATGKKVKSEEPDEAATSGKTIARVGKSKSTGKKIIEYTDGSREYAD